MKNEVETIENCQRAKKDESNICVTTKRAMVVRIFDILRTHSDESHKLTKKKIVGYLERLGYSYPERKITKDLESIQDVGISVEISNKGAYLIDREFDDGEVRLLCDGVLANRYIKKEHAEELVGKLLNLGSPTLRERVNYEHGINSWTRSGNSCFTLNVDLITQAIASGKKVAFMYNRYNADKTLIPRYDAKVTVSPYNLLVHNQRYYLICNKDKTDNISFYRMDYISDLEIIGTKAKSPTQVKDYVDVSVPGRISNRFPYLFHDTVEEVTLEVDKSGIGEIIDWFGTDFAVTEKDSGDYIVKLKCSLLGIKFWLMQYGGIIKATSPQKLVDMMRDETKKLYEKYYNTEKN